MNLEDYRFTYNGDDVYMQFFKEKSLKDWNYKTFKSHFSTLRNPPTKKTLVIAYKHCLKVIKNNPATPKCIKPLIEKLLKDLNDSSSVSPTNVYNINQGPSSIVNYGNNNNISTVGQKRVFDNIEQEQTKKDTPSSASNVQKSHQLRDKIDDLFNPLPDSSLSPAQFRNNIYACGIKILSKTSNDSDTAYLRQMIHFYKPVTLGEKLDMMSARLMNEIDLNDIHQVNALKLSLSRIVDTVNANVKSIFQKYIQDEVFWQKISNTSIELCPGMSEEEKKLYNTIIQRSKDDCNDKIDLLQLRLNIVLEKANMIQSSQTNNLKLLDIMEIVTKNCTDDITKINKKESETTCYRKLAKILDELLEGTNLDMLDGEITCEATKIIAKEQAKIFSNTIRLSRSFGRRIDLILSAKEIELSANEWKKEKTVITQSLKQQNKNLRVNKAILTHVEKLPLENEIFIIGMDWTGFMGYMFGLKHLEDIYIAKHISNLIIPKYSCQISSFIETLDRLYSWKNSLIMLKNIVLNATLKHEESEFFARVGTTPAPTQAKSLSPNIYLTPHRKKAVYSNIDEDIYDEDVYDEDDYNDNEHDIF